LRFGGKGISRFTIRGLGTWRSPAGGWWPAGLDDELPAVEIGPQTQASKVTAAMATDFTPTSLARPVR